MTEPVDPATLRYTGMKDRIEGELVTVVCAECAQPASHVASWRRPPDPEPGDDGGVIFRAGYGYTERVTYCHFCVRHVVRHGDAPHELRSLPAWDEHVAAVAAAWAEWEKDEEQMAWPI